MEKQKDGFVLFYAVIDSALSIAGIYLSSWGLVEHPNAWWSFPTFLTGLIVAIAFAMFAVAEFRKKAE